MEGLPTEDIFKVLDSDMIFIFNDVSHATLYNTIRETPVVRDEFAKLSIDLYKCPEVPHQALDHHPLHNVDWQFWQDRIDAICKAGSDMLNSFGTHSTAAGVSKQPAVQSHSKAISSAAPASASASSASASSASVSSVELDLTKVQKVQKVIQTLTEGAEGDPDLTKVSSLTKVIQTLAECAEFGDPDPCRFWSHAKPKVPGAFSKKHNATRRREERIIRRRWRRAR